MIKDLETAAYMAGYKAGLGTIKPKLGTILVLIWMGLMTAGMAVAMFFLAGWYINDYFCF